MARPRKPLRPIIPHPTDPSLALVELTRGYYATISAVDGPDVGRFNWLTWYEDGAPTPYAMRTARAPGKTSCEKLHRFIGRAMGIPDHLFPDHINGNGLDCRRSNLRAATNQQNGANSRISKNSSTGVKGVARHRTRPHSPERFVARVMVDGKSIYLGKFDTIPEAAAVVRAARERLHGEFANHGDSN